MSTHCSKIPNIVFFFFSAFVHCVWMMKDIRHKHFAKKINLFKNFKTTVNNYIISLWICNGSSFKKCSTFSGHVSCLRNTNKIKLLCIIIDVHSSIFCVSVFLNEDQKPFPSSCTCQWGCPHGSALTDHFVWLHKGAPTTRKRHVSHIWHVSKQLFTGYIDFHPLFQVCVIPSLLVGEGRHSATLTRCTPPGSPEKMLCVTA